MAKRAIIIGASSGIGREVAKLLMQEGWTIGVAARRIDKLQELSAAAVEQIDVTQEDATTRLQSLINCLGGMDLFFYASGIGKQNRELQEDIELATVYTNGLGFTRMIGEAYRYFANKGSGHIAAITSIAGTKGLGPAPSYSATKAMQNVYLQALEQQANARGLNIKFTDIRPGFEHQVHGYPSRLRRHSPPSWRLPLPHAAPTRARSQGNPLRHQPPAAHPHHRLEIPSPHSPLAPHPPLPLAPLQAMIFL